MSEQVFIYDEKDFTALNDGIYKAERCLVNALLSEEGVNEAQVRMGLRYVAEVRKLKDKARVSMASAVNASLAASV